jgi:hypothetical protein
VWHKAEASEATRGSLEAWAAGLSRWAQTRIGIESKNILQVPELGNIARRYISVDN